METEFIYWRHNTPAGVMVEEICGGDDKSAAIWKAMALQVFGENGKDRYREIDHTEIGAPILVDEPQRISVSHTTRFLCVASLPRTPEANLEKWSPRTAMGIDCEKVDRDQIMKVRERVMSADEIAMAGESVELSILLWTCKEALYKAALQPGLDFKEQLIVKQLPHIYATPAPLPQAAPASFGLAEIKSTEGQSTEMSLYSYRSEGHIITIAFSPKCAKFHAISN